jgi:uncharacterized protein YjbI with pentapeptide repeats
MQSQDHLALLKELGVAGWNQWRKDNPDVTPDFQRDSFYGLFYGDEEEYHEHHGAAEGSSAKPGEAGVPHPPLVFIKPGPLTAKGIRAQLEGIDLSRANLSNCFLEYANLENADLTGAYLEAANLASARLINARLDRAVLKDANLRRADLSHASLREASLMYAQLNGANLAGADLTDSNIYGVSAWNVQVDGSTCQSKLRIQNYGEPTIRVPSLEMAQFYYLLRDHSRLRDVINAVVTKGVLLLGRFTPRRKRIIDAMADALSDSGYLPIVFDFEEIPGKDLSETILTLAGLSRFIIADITEPKSVQQETATIIPLMKIPLFPIIQRGHRPWSLFGTYATYDWVIQPGKEYRGKKDLIESLPDIVKVAERKFEALAARKGSHTFEMEPTT